MLDGRDERAGGHGTAATPTAIVAHIAEDVIWRDVALGMPLHGRDGAPGRPRRRT